MVAITGAPPATSPAEGLLIRRSSTVHALPAQVKLVATITFVLVAVLTPAPAWPAFVGYSLLLVAVIWQARLPARTVLRRMGVEVPFILFALLMPFVAAGPRVVVWGLELSRSGLEGGALLLARGTLGVVAAVVLAATTESRDLLVGLGRLRMPTVLVGILGFAIRYLSIAQEDLRRAEIARLARGGRSGKRAQLRAVAGSAGATFVRTYERGERVHRAMLARGLDGPVPRLEGAAPTRKQWLCAGTLPLGAALILGVVLLVP